MRIIYIISAVLAVLSAVICVRHISQIWMPFAFFFAEIIALSFLYWFVLGIFSLFFSVKKEYKKPSKLAFRMLNAAYYFVNTAARIRVHVSGTELIPKDKRFLFVSNHISRFDPMIQSYVLRRYPMAFISKPANFKIPIGRRFMNGTCYIAINRESPRQAAKSITRAAELIKENLISVAVYPEGHRGNGIELGEFKPGSLKTALKADCSIVVAVIEGTQNVKKNFPWHVTDVYLNIIDVMEPCKEKTVDLAVHIKDKIQRELDIKKIP